MRSTYLLGVAVMAAVPILGCQPGAEPSSESETAMEEAPISDEELLSEQTDAFAAAWADGNAGGIAALFVDEGDTVGPEGARFHGREAIQGRYETLLSEVYPGTAVDIVQKAVKFPSPEVAIVSGTYEILGAIGDDGSELTIKGLYTNVAVKENGEWKIHCSRPMIPLPVPGAGT